jgi:hypothetical protein
MSHYNLGYNEYTHKGKVIRTIVGNTEADSFIESFDSKGLDSGAVPPEYVNRPDLIADIFYGDTRSFWYVCFTSLKYDVFEDFKVGSRIVIPNE